MASRRIEGTCVDHSWRHVLRQHYGRRHAEAWDVKTHHSQHYFITIGRQRYVLSRYAHEPGRHPFDHQFTIVTALTEAGFTMIRQPVPTVDGRCWAEHDGDRWVLRHFTDADADPGWTDPELIRHSAQALAELHIAAAHAASRLPVDRPPDDLTPFCWSVGDFHDRLGLVLAGFPWTELDDSDAHALRSCVDWLTSRADDLLPLAAEHDLVGLTHQDYRPANLRVRGGQIVDVLDWDLARTDNHLYDAAFAALQFGGRECLFPEIDLDLASLFLTTYLNARALTGLPGEAPDLLPWMLRFTVLKRLLLGWHITARLDLLARLDRYFPIPQYA
jgi:Ser/Thr protein kinase RdoA (MazF antagonist)